MEIFANAISVICEKCVAQQDLQGVPVTGASRFTCSSCGHEQNVVPAGAASLAGTIRANEVTILQNHTGDIKM